jgi:hypothetical protein
MYELIPPDLPQLMRQGEARRISHGPSTIGEVLDRARLAMDEEDRREEMERDPIAYARAHRPRRCLLDRLLLGR